MKKNQQQSISAAELTWGDVFPVLAEDPSAVWVSRGPVSADLGNESRLVEISSLVAYTAVENSPNEPLAKLFPAFSQSGFEIPWASLDTRTMNCLTREGIFETEALTALTISDLQCLRNAGSLTVLRILKSMIQVSIDLLTFSAELETEKETVDLGSETKFVLNKEVSDSSGVLAALRTLAEWHCLRGAEDAPLRSSTGLAGCPDRVGAAWDLIEKLRPNDFVDPEQHQPALLLDALLIQLDDNSLLAARRRLFASEPDTLEQVGQELGLTRERVRQILNKTFRMLNDPSTDVGERIQELSRAVRIHIGTFCTLEKLLEGFPALTSHVSLAEQPAWRVLDRLDDSFEIEDGWAAVPTVQHVLALTKEAISQHSNRFGLAPIHAVAREMGMGSVEREAEFLAWLEYCGATLHGEEVVARSLSIPDWAAVILNSAGEPMSIKEIQDRMPVDRAKSSIRNALAEDDRFVRADRDAFGLSEWGGQEYTGIRDLIAKEIERHGGEASQDELVSALTEAFDVAESSVRTYSQAFPFEMRGGLVRMRGRAPEKVLDPSRVRRLFRADCAWKFRMTINADHARGSGSVLSSILAGVLGLQEGESRTLSSGSTEQSIYWTGMQPILGSIRRFIQDGTCSEGDDVFAIFHDDSSFSIEKIEIPDSATGIKRALCLVGISGDSFENPRELLAGALSINLEPSWASIINTARDRGDVEIANALLSDDSIDAQDGAIQKTLAGVSVDEILRLL